MHTLHGPRVRYDDDPLAIQIFEANVVDSVNFPDGLKSLRPTPYVPRKMCKGPILPTACDVCCLRVNRHQPPARKRPDVGPALFVQSKIPARNRLRPVACDLHKSLSPPCPVGQIVRCGNVWPTLGPINLRLGISFMKLAHLIRSTHISVERHRVAVLVDGSVIELCHGTPPKIVVVIKNPDLRRKSALLECRSEMALHESHLVFL